jgi:hypothetical protein
LIISSNTHSILVQQSEIELNVKIKQRHEDEQNGDQPLYRTIPAALPPSAALWNNSAA